MRDHPFLFFGLLFVFHQKDFFEFALIIKSAVLYGDLGQVFVEFGVRFFVHDIVNLDADGLVSAAGACLLEVGLLDGCKQSADCQRRRDDGAVILKDSGLYRIAASSVDKGACALFFLNGAARLISFCRHDGHDACGADGDVKLIVIARFLSDLDKTQGQHIAHMHHFFSWVVELPVKII